MLKEGSTAQSECLIEAAKAISKELPGADEASGLEIVKKCKCNAFRKMWMNLVNVREMICVDENAARGGKNYQQQPSYGGHAAHHPAQYGANTLWFQYAMCQGLDFSCYFFTKNWNQGDFGQYHLYDNLLGDGNLLGGDNSLLPILALSGGLSGGHHGGYHGGHHGGHHGGNNIIPLLALSGGFGNSGSGAEAGTNRRRRHAGEDDDIIITQHFDHDDDDDDDRMTRHFDHDDDDDDDDDEKRRRRRSGKGFRIYLQMLMVFLFQLRSLVAVTMIVMMASPVWMPMLASLGSVGRCERLLSGLDSPEIFKFKFGCSNKTCRAKYIFYYDFVAYL